MLVGQQAEEGRILVPSGDRVGLWFLYEEGAGEDQQVGPEQRFHHIQEAWIADEVARPGTAGMQLAPVLRRDGAGWQGSFECFEVGAPGPRFLDRENVDRRVVAVALEGIDLALAQLGHGQVPVPVSFASGPHLADSPARNVASASGPTLGS